MPAVWVDHSIFVSRLLWASTVHHSHLFCCVPCTLDIPAIERDLMARQWDP